VKMRFRRRERGVNGQLAGCIVRLSKLVERSTLTMAEAPAIRSAS
jgi:hypothetical protein